MGSFGNSSQEPKEALGAQAQIQVQYGGRWSISLERCSSGKDQERACVPEFQAIPPGVMKYAGDQPGYAVIRLWSPPDLSPGIYVSGACSSKGLSGLGRRSETIVETISFSGSTEAALSKGHSASGPRIINSTHFENAKGQPVPSPSYNDGVYRTTESCWGAMVVEYSASYSAYRVYYGLPDWLARKVYMEGGRLEDYTVPPVMVMAIDKGHSAHIQIERRIAKVSPPDCQNNDFVTDTANSQVVKYKVYPESSMNYNTTPPSPKPGASYLITTSYLKHVTYCKHRTSLTRTESYSLPRGDNIEIISVYNGEA